MSKHYPSYVICVDGEPLIETDGSIVLYQEGDDMRLGVRFMAMVALSDRSDLLTIKKYQLVPHSFESSMDECDFLKRARETREIG